MHCIPNSDPAEMFFVSSMSLCVLALEAPEQGREDPVRISRFEHQRFEAVVHTTDQPDRVFL